MTKWEIHKNHKSMEHDIFYQVRISIRYTWYSLEVDSNGF